MFTIYFNDGRETITVLDWTKYQREAESGLCSIYDEIDEEWIF